MAEVFPQAAGTHHSTIDATGISRVLIYRLGSLGDTVVALPALHLVARAFPQARRLMLTNLPVHAKAPPASAILGGAGESGLVHGYLSYPVGTRSPRGLLRLWWSIRRYRPDILVYLARPRGERAVLRDARFFRLCGIRRIAGLPLRDRAVNLQLGGDRWESEAARLARCVRELGEIDVGAASSWELSLSGAEKARAQSALSGLQEQPVIACAPGTKMQAKDWGMENWRALLSRLGERFPGRGLALVGAKEERQTCEALQSAWPGRAVNLCGELSPRETAAVLAHTELFLGPDSGPMHFAAAAGVPCVIAFAARTMPGIWFPRGQGHRVLYRQVECAGCDLEICIEKKKKCLTSITVDDMLAAAVEAWTERHGARLPSVGV